MAPEDDNQPQQEMAPLDKCKDLRVRIDQLIQYAGSIKNDTRPEYAKGKREAALVYTKLQEAKMWTGKIMEELGSELPEEFRDQYKR